MNKSLFIQVEITKNLLLFSDNNTFYINQVLFLICSTLERFFFNFSLYKYIVWLEMSTRKYAFGYEKLKKEKKINWVSKRING